MGIDEEWVRQGAGQGVCKLFLLKISKNTTQSVIPYSQPLKTHMDTESLWYIIRENSSWLSLVSPIWNSKGQWISGSLYYTEMRDGQIARQPAHSTPSMDLHRRASPGPQVLVESRKKKKRRVETQTNQCTQVGQTKGSSSRKVPAALVFTETSLPTSGSSLAQWEDFQSAGHCFLVVSIWTWGFPLNSYGWISEIQVETLSDRIPPGYFSCCGWWEKLELNFSLCWSPRVRWLLRYPRDKQETAQLWVFGSIWATC